MSNKRQQIIEVAAALMHSKGYENTKISDILDAAQLGKGQFYHYFSSKHELGLAILDHFFANWNRRLMENVLSSQQDPKIKFDAMFESIIELHRNNQAKCGCVFGNLAIEMSEHDEIFRKKLEAVFDIWTEKLKQVFDNMISPVQVESSETGKLAQGIVAMIEGGILLMKNKQDISTLVNVAEQAKILVDCFVQRHTLLGVR